MANRLLVRLPSGPARFSLDSRPVVLGSGPDCQICLDHPTLSKRHACLQLIDGGRLLIEDLGSSNGTFADGRRIRDPTPVDSGSRLTFGSLYGELEEILDGDASSAFVLEEPLAAEDPIDDPSEAAAASWVAGRVTLATDILEQFTLQTLPEILAAVESRLAPQLIVGRLGAAFWTQLPICEVQICDLSSADETPCFVAGEAPSGRGHVVDEQDGNFSIRMTLSSKGMEGTIRVLSRLGLQLLRLAGGHTPPIAERGADRAPPPVPDPPSVMPEMQKIYEHASRMARGPVNMLILGESGTGKEVLSRYLHRVCVEGDAPFVALNCAALPRDLLEAELFGIEKGVATGVQARAGKFEAAHGGTLFLDEIGDMTLETQAKILRVLQERTVYRLGGSDPHRVDIQVISATNRDLRAMIEEGTFRADLFYRLAGWEIRLPALRERQADIANLAVHFFKQEAHSRGLTGVGISVSALEAIKTYSWPGNIRQLHHEITRCVLMLPAGELLTTHHLSPELLEASAREQTLEAMLEDAERRCIATALDRSDESLEQIAQQLGISRTTLYRRMRDLGLDRETD